jgi:hypothetical protein
MFVVHGNKALSKQLKLHFGLLGKPMKVTSVRWTCGRTIGLGKEEPSQASALKNELSPEHSGFSTRKSALGADIKKNLSERIAKEPSP